MTDNIPQSIAASDLPQPGQPLAGGIFVTRYWLNGQERALVLLPASAEIEGEWGEYGQDVIGARSYSDGEANTRAMAEAGSHIAVKAIEGAGFIPSSLEGQLVMAAKHAGLVADLRQDRWYWLSSQSSANLAYYLDFSDGGQSTSVKLLEARVRPVRRKFL
ncbi:hypothetical protein [Azotobacter vinelandii]